MARRKKQQQDAVEVRKVPNKKKGAQAGKPDKIMTGAMRMKTAFSMASGTTVGAGGNFYSPELSTDFLELPQSIDEQRNFYRHFYKHEPFVGQAIDLHTELPLSKLRVSLPITKDRQMAEKALRFCEQWSKKVRLLHRLLEITHEYHLLGEVFIFCEDINPNIPREIREEPVREITSEGKLLESWVPYDDANAREVAWLKNNYKGWTAIKTLPPEQIQMESFPFTDEHLFELVPDSKSKDVVNKAQQGDIRAAGIVDSMSADIVGAILAGENLPLNTDPDAGSFVYYLARKRSQYEERGSSILQRCLLPGTPIWIKRDGIVQQVSVENVNENTDTMLTHKGRFKPCKAGSRPVNEVITVLDIAGITENLSLTSDHEVLRVNGDGTEDWVEAGKLQPGDMVREGHIVPDGDPIKTINLVDWWQNHFLSSVKRGRPDMGLPETCRELVVHKAYSNEEGLTVTFHHDNDNKNRVKATSVLEKILTWAKSLVTPITMPQAAVAVAAGVSERDVRVYTPRLRKEGMLRVETKSLGRGKGQSSTWYPADTDKLPPVITEMVSPISEIIINEDFCYLLGTWMGDGCVWTETESLLNVHSIGWSLHDKDIAAHVNNLAGRCFKGSDIKKGCLVSKVAKSNDIRIEDPLLARWFKEEFGHTAQGKHLPEWVFHLSDKHIMALLQGLLDTDGWLGVGKAYRIEFALDNKVLIDQIHLLCNRVGIKSKVGIDHKKARSWTRTWDTKDGTRTKTYHYEAKDFPKLSCSRSEDVRRWAKGSIKGSRAIWDNRGVDKRGGPKTINGWMVHKIKSVSHVLYKGPVYSFNVEGDTSHFTLTITHNCMRTLVFRDKVRQSMTSIASRHMTPYRLVWAEDMNDDQTEELREQVDLALQDPDYSIITSFQVNWEEMGADQRLPDWSWVWDFTDRQLYAGLGVTEGLLSGESSYAGDRLHLEVINTRYMLLRELLQDLVEEYFFKPMCRRMGFVEEDQDGNLEVVVPRLSFTRLALRDNADTFDALFNLYQKGSLDIDTILDLLNIDPVTTKEKLLRDFGTLNDATFNEVLRGAYSRVGEGLVEGSNLTEKVASGLGLQYTKPVEEGSGRF